MTIPTTRPASTTGRPEIRCLRVISSTSRTVIAGEIVIGSLTTPLSNRLTFATSAACRAGGRFLWMTPSPPSWAMAIASRASVTVSIAADTSGTLRVMPRVRRVARETSRGTTVECAGTSRTSSKVSALRTTRIGTNSSGAKTNYTRADRSPARTFDAPGALDYLANVIGNRRISHHALPEFVPAQSPRSRRCPSIRPAALPALALALLLSAGVDAATLYKWTDANGGVVYSDQPPAGNIKWEAISGPPPRANPDAVKDMVNREADLKKKQVERTETTQKSQKEAADARLTQQTCVRVRDQIRQLGATQDVLVRINEKGERVVVSPEARQRERENLEKWAGQNCRP